MNAATQERLSVLRADGKTPAQAATALAADVVTAQDIRLPVLAGWLGTNGLGLTLKRTVANAAYPQPLRDGIETLLDQLAWRTGKDEALSTHTSESVAQQFDQITKGLVQTGIITAPQLAEVLQMAGGYRYERLTADEIAAHWEAEDAAAAALAAKAAAIEWAAPRWNALMAAIEAGEYDIPTLAAFFATE